MKHKFTRLIVVMAAAPMAHAAITVQELFDDISLANATLNGAADTATSLGMTGVWATNGGTGIFTANNFNTDGVTVPELPSNAGANGGVWNNTSSYSTAIHATRPLAAPIDFGTARVLYFSVRLNNSGDTSMGIGLAAGAGGSAEFIGAGFTWNNARALATGALDSGNAAYISHGTLDADSGVYGIRAHEPINSVNGFGLLVGRITINATGPDVIEIKRYAADATIDNNPDALVWSATSTVDSAMVASHLLLWVNGAGSGQIDAIRLGSSWTDVTGVELAAPEQPALVEATVSGISTTGAQAAVSLRASAADVTLHWGTTDGGTGAWEQSNVLGARAIGPVTGSITGLAVDTRYFYRFQGVNAVAEPDLVGWSEPGLSFATALSGKAVTDLAALPYSAFEVDVSWTDNFATETGYLIQRSPAGTGAWATVATVPADSSYYNDVQTGLTPATAYDYRVIAINGTGNSDPSNVVAGATTLAATPLETQLLIHFDGVLDAGYYVLNEGEIDTTGTFRANGAPVLSGGLATLNPGNENGPDGFDINPALLGNLNAQNWVAELLVIPAAVNPSVASVPMDIMGDCNLRFLTPGAGGIQMFHYNGTTAARQTTDLPQLGAPVHLALAWDAATTTLTGYVNGVSFGSVSQGAFSTPDRTTLSFGYFGRIGFEGRGIDGVLDAVAFQSGTTAFDPASDFLILPEGVGYASWIGGFPVGTRTGFNDDADGDGLNNGIEGFFGTDPSLPNSGLRQIDSDGTVTTFVHPKASPALTDVTGTYQWSPDLITWYAGNGLDGPGGGPTVNLSAAPAGNGIVTVTATSSVPVPRLFVRVVASHP